ncbi:SH3 domain-containing protein [Priestia flexa]|uniref:SH3 domain-containing protein n=3 Tax=Priestia flexa TaxID=86664 RepID=UPI00240E4781|nr:SH3 domain-containing protein [Priestia flexa]WEZ06720.1 SH3 domain-containing protein [Priestia flexa]
MNNKHMMYAVCTTAALSSSALFFNLEAEAAQPATVNATSLNVRAIPSTSGAIVGKLYKGNTINVLTEQQGWAKIQLNGKDAWISSEYIEKKTSSTNVVSKQATVNASSLNVRSAASTSASIVTNLPRNAKVTVIKENGDWSQIKTSNGKTGWVANQYLKVGSESTTPSSESGGTSVSKQATVNASSLNVRSAASTSASIVTNLPRNAKVTVIKENGDWSQIKTSDGKTGWVANQYLKVGSESTTPSSESGGTSVSKQATVNASSLNVRSAASTSASIVTNLPRNAKVTVIKENGDWSQIKTSDGKTGWVANKYLADVKADAPKDEGTSVSKQATVNASSLNVRSAASTSASIVTNLPRNAKVTVIKENGDWSQIKTSDGKTGWVANKYLADVKADAPKDEGTSVSKQATVNASSLNVRSAASTSASIVTNLPRNAKVTVIKENGDWSQIKTSDGKTGWVANKYLADVKADAPKDEGTSVSKQATVNASSLNVRSAASTSASIVTNLPRNAKVTVIKENGDWSQIKTSNGKTGWVANKYLADVKADAPKDEGTSVSKQATVNASSLNVRSAASTSASIVTNLPRNAKVTVIKENGDWSQIKTSNGKTGWVANKYLADVKADAPKDEGTSVSKQATVNASSLNVRSAASTSASIVTNLPRNAKVTVIKENGDWSQIKTSNGKTGWVANQYLKEGYDQPETNNPTEKVTITKAANLRTQPSLSASILRVAQVGESFNKVAESNGWVQIQYSSSQTAWVSKGLTSTEAPSTPGEVTNPTSGLEKKLIVIDPGHGGHDPGAVGQDELEKNLALRTAKLVAAQVESAGGTVLFTRSDDTFISLDGRTKISNASEADAFVSIHYNAGSSSATGIETYYYSARDQELAKYIQESMVQHTNMRDRGAQQANFYVLKHNNKRSVLVELGFVSNPSEEDRIATEQYQQQVSRGIAEGISRYFAATK